MSVESKAVFLNAVELEFANLLTMADTTRALAVISDVLARFDVEEVQIDGGAGTDDLMQAYLSAMQIEGRSPKTVERYRYLIGKMRKALGIPTRQITVYHLRKYLADRKQDGLSDRTLEGERQVFSAYFNWLQRENLIRENPTANLGTIKSQKKVKKVYSETDIEKLKAGCKTVRDRAIIAFLLSTGCRVSEMVQLNRDDVHLDSLECTVLGKGNKERTVYLSGVAGMHLRDYLHERTDNVPALFVGKRKERLTAGGVRRMMRELEIATNVEHVHPHKFRRTLATNLIRHGMPIQEVASILGHDKLDTTMQYVVLDKTEVQNSYRKFGL